MRIFISDVRAELAAGEDQSVLVRQLLAYAVGRVWGREVPEIIKDGRGKPAFRGAEDMHFSLSHSKTHVLVAVSEKSVGADIESRRAVRNGYERLFSAKMLSDFGYIGGWCLREAVFKLRGEGELRRMEIKRGEDGIVTPFEGVRCRLYELPDCIIAAAAWDDDFPALPEIVPSERFCERRA